MPSQPTTPLRVCARCGVTTKAATSTRRLLKPTVLCRPCIIADDSLIEEHVRSRLVAAECGCCRIWPFAKESNGYGVVGLSGQNFLVHRLILQAKVGPLPRTKFACHDCPCGDRKDCAEISHLYIGTPKQNSEDAAKKGQAPRGERHGMVRLTEAEVLSIPDRLQAGQTRKEIAAALCVSESAIWMITSGQNWVYLGIATAKRSPGTRA